MNKLIKTNVYRSSLVGLYKIKGMEPDVLFCCCEFWAAFLFTVVVKSAYLCPVNSHQSGHSPLISLIYKMFQPGEHQRRFILEHNFLEIVVCENTKRFKDLKHPNQLIWYQKTCHGKNHKDPTFSDVWCEP